MPIKENHIIQVADVISRFFFLQIFLDNTFVMFFQDLDICGLWGKVFGLRSLHLIRRNTNVQTSTTLKISTMIKNCVYHGILNTSANVFILSLLKIWFQGKFRWRWNQWDLLFSLWKHMKFQFCLVFCCTWRVPMSQSGKSAHITKEAKLFAR